MKEIGTFKIDKNMCSNCREDGNCPQEYSVIGNCLRTEKNLIIEQVPENFSELKELCKKTEHYAVNILKGGLLNKEYIFIFGLSFRDNGDIEDIENNNVAENRTPAQMWQIIKNLIGE